MNKLWSITLNDLREVFSNRGIWVNLVVVPVILVILIGIATSGFAGDASDSGESEEVQRPRPVRVDLINDDDGELASNLVEILVADERLLVCPMENDEDNTCRLNTETLTAEASASRVDTFISRALILIPSGFSESALAGEPAEVFYRSQEDPTQTSTVFAAVQNGIQRISGSVVAERVGGQVADELHNLDVNGQFIEILSFDDETEAAAYLDAVYARAAEIWQAEPVMVSFEVAIPEAMSESNIQIASGFAQSVPGMGSMYVMFTVIAGMVTLLQERKQWTLQRLAVMPVAKWHILGGKMLARFLLGMIQYLVLFTVGYFLGLRYSNIPALLLMMTAFSAIMTALTFALATVVTSEAQASGLSLFMTLTLAPLGGAWWPLEIVPSWMQQVAKISPFSWAMQGFTNILIRDGGFTDVLVPAGVLVGAAAVLFMIAIARFQYDT